MLPDSTSGLEYLYLTTYITIIIIIIIKISNIYIIVLLLHTTSTY